MLATYMRRMRHNKMEIRIAGSSCRPQKKKKKNSKCPRVCQSFGIDLHRFPFIWK